MFYFFLNGQVVQSERKLILDKYVTALILFSSTYVPNSVISALALETKGPTSL